MSIRGWLFVVSVSFLILSGCGQNKEKIIAEVNGENITAEEFAERYKAYMSQGGQRDNILLRQKILNNMVNERLIYADCTRQYFDSDEQYRRKIEEIESQALIDAYARSVSTDTITVSEPELSKEFKAFNTKVKARYLYADSEDGALKLKEALAHGATFDSLARDVFEDPGLANNGGDVGYFGWGEMEPAFEDAAYSLPLYDISEPIRLKIGYGIIQVLDRVSNPLPSEMDYAKAKEKLRRAIIQKKALKLISDAGHNIAKDLSPQFDEKTVGLIYRHWQFLLDENAMPEQQPVFRDTLKDLPLARFKDESWTVSDFVTRAMKTTKGQRRRVKKELDVKDFVTGLAVRDALLDRARKASLAEDKEAKSQIKKARDTYLLKRWVFSVQDTVGRHGYEEKMLREQFEKNRKEYAVPPEVNIAEILVKTKQEADQLIAQLRRGADFAKLAEKHSLRRATAKRGGEIGWGTRSTFGNLGEKFLSGKAGSITGPEFVDPYFGVFKILAKEVGRPKSFEESKEQIAAVLTSGKKLEIVEQCVNALRSRAKIAISNDQLANISIN